MSQVAGSWYCGQADSDKSVARAATDALHQTFHSQEKVANFAKLLQRSIVEYCRDAVLRETPQTLSDERTVSEEDSSATYNRVVSTSLTTVSTLITTLAPEELQKQSEVYSVVVSEKQIWEFSAASEASTRRSDLRLLAACLSSPVISPLLDHRLIGAVLINKALSADQTSTATDLTVALTRLTEKHPEIWTSDYKGRKPPDYRLRHLFKQGSQHSPAGFWPSSVVLLKTIPAEVLPNDRAGVSDLLHAVVEGVTHKDERLNASDAWNAYLDISDLLISHASNDDGPTLLQDWIMPIITQFLEPSQSLSQWTLPSQSSEQIVAKALKYRELSSILAGKWPEMTTNMLDLVKMSQPEQSKGLLESQEKAEMAGRRWVALQSAVVPSKSPNDAHDLPTIFAEQRTRVVHDLAAVLVARKGKPFAAASILEQISTRLGTTPNDAVKGQMVKFLKDDATSLLFSPSQSYIMGTLYSTSTDSDFDQLWDTFATKISAQPDLEHLQALDAFLTLAKADQAVERAKRHDGIQEFLQKVLDSRHAFAGEKTVPHNLMACLSDDATNSVLSNALECLSLLDNQTSALQTLEDMDSLDSQTLPRFISSTGGRSLLTKVAALEQSSSPEVAIKAEALHHRLTGVGVKTTSPTYSLELIRSEITTMSTAAVNIETILGMTRAALSSSQAGIWSILSEVLPIWTNSLKDCDSSRMDSSLAIMSPLAGAVHLIREEPSQISVIVHDSHGLSQATRIGLFTAEVLSAGPTPTNFDATTVSQILYLLLRTAVMADAETSILSKKNTLITSPSPITIDFISRARRLVRDRFLSEDYNSTFFQGFRSIFMANPALATKEGYSNAQVFLEVNREWVDANGFNKAVVESLEQTIKSLKQQSAPMALCAATGVLAPRLGSSPSLQRYCNELVSDLTVAHIDHDEYETMSKLVSLNIILQEAENLEGLIAKQRIVFFMKHILDWIVEPEIPSLIKSEVCHSLRYVLPLIGDIYGKHFGVILQTVTKIWQESRFVDQRTGRVDGHQVLLANSTIHLYNTLVSLSKGQDANEDLTDALRDHHTDLMAAIMDLLVSPQLVARLAQQTEIVTSEKAADLYPLLDSKSSSIQEAAFVLLQRYTEQNQEQISFDAALDKKTAHLPEELLSLVLSAPSLESVLSASFEPAMPEDLQSYLYSWLLIFSHFTKASLKVKEDYAEDIRSSDHLPPLLDLTYEFLGHATGNPVDVSKYDIVNYVRDREQDPERDTEWLLAHLYYLALTYLPSLTKAHFLSISNRQTSASISKWIAKHFSPLIMTASMRSVSDWSQSFASDADYENFSVKVRPRAQEITASYLIDEQTMTILVRLPDAYPLEGARVEGVSRVAVDSRKWLSWLRNCQGVIQFSNGDIVDGLSSWRRNVIGALKGQTECYICYSVISADRQLPNKRCGTCKNLFHSGCLFKWFKTSNASSCPLCRTAFNYS
ncbi:hypothetical protein ANO11243_037250 [Dothideomycetidae sp. 11243]|nr:hypothetical protein ANO11243_037250 [fungal sp. No.11243]